MKEIINVLTKSSLLMLFVGVNILLYAIIYYILFIILMIGG